MASDCCEEIFARNRLPILVGGTGLYIDSLLSGRSFAERSDRENDIRNELNREYDERGGTAMWSELNSVDPERAERLSPNDRKRIVRALEIYRLTGKTITQHDAETLSLPPRYDSLMVALDYVQRDDLYARINRRVDQMLENGLVPEVQALLDLGLNDDHTAMQAIGYKEMVEYINGNISIEQAIESIKQGSRHYAKRQLTWFKNRENFHVIDRSTLTDPGNEMIDIMQSFI
jgi:tRNA dimethylallyltransferase